MKRGLQVFLGLTLLAALAEGLILIRIRIEPWLLAALLESVALLVGAFVGLTQAAFVKQLREWAVASPVLAAGLPFLLLIPYLVLALPTRTFTLIAFGKLIAYILVPVALLLPDRLRHRPNLTWRDAPPCWRWRCRSRRDGCREFGFGRRTSMFSGRFSASW